MSNYKGIKFPNTLDGFKRWAMEFPHMCNSDIKARAYYKHEDYYLECNKVVIRELSGKPFLGTSLRGYSHEERDFGKHYSTEDQSQIIEMYFSEQVEAFCNKYGIVQR